ncbi:MAG: hypothetical protein H7338_00885 [Candidatus Sericytochromatia bacterium]|nr:hypothetical protein [Candidatus Sericytochromatia bacterium]
MRDPGPVADPFRFRLASSQRHAIAGPIRCRYTFRQRIAKSQRFAKPVTDQEPASESDAKPIAHPEPEPDRKCDRGTHFGDGQHL